MPIKAVSTNFVANVLLGALETRGICSVLEKYTKLNPTRRWARRAIGDFLWVSGGGGAKIGSGLVEAADTLERWFGEAGIDCFDIADPMPLETFCDFGRYVPPDLRERSKGASYPKQFHGAEQPGLRSSYPGWRYNYQKSIFEAEERSRA